MKSRFPPSRKAGFSGDETALLRKAGAQLLASLSDEEISAEMDRRSREVLLDWGLLEKRNERPARPRTGLTARIEEQKTVERERKAAMHEAWAVVVEAQGEALAASRAHPDDPDREARAGHALREAEADWREAERAWRRCRSGKHALQLAEDRFLALREYESGLKRRERRRANR